MSTINSRQFLIYPLPTIKGICILSVILMHFGRGQLGTEYFGTLTSLGILAYCLAQFAVPLFITLSGLYLSLNRANERPIPFYRRTLKFLLIPYCVYSLIYSLPAFRKNGDILQIAKNLITGSAAVHLWFGLLILQLYILHPYLRRLFQAKKNHKKILFSAFLVQIVYTFALCMILREPDPPALNIGLIQRFVSILFVSHIGYFLAGYYLLEKADDMVRLLADKKAAIIGGLLFLLTGFALYSYWGIPISKGITAAAPISTFLAQSILPPILTFAALLAIYPLVQKSRPNQNILWRILHSFGLYSYGVYYLHIFVGWIVVWMAERFPILGIENTLLNFIILVAVASMTLLLVRFLTRLPFGRYMT